MSKKTNYKVYVHISPNGKRYYGITKQKVEKRWGNGKGYRNNEYFYRAINKYGWNNFEHIVIAKGLTEEEAKWLEIELIRELDTTNPKYGYNQSLGGEGANGREVTEETRKKISEGHKGKTHTEETKEKLSEINKGKTLSEETKNKISEANKGKNKGKTRTEETKNKISEANKGKTRTEETKNKISEAIKGENNPNYGKTFGEETRKKMSEAKKGENKGKNNPNATKVYCVELDMYFDTVKEGAEFVGCHRANISGALDKSSKTCGGYHWLRAENVNEKNINKVLSKVVKDKKGKNNPNSKQIYCVELDKYFNTINEASEFVGRHRKNISRVLGKNGTCGGYHWLYAEDRDKLAS